MSGLVVYTPATGADWATAWEQAEYGRKGKMGLSLTNYDATTLPAIAAGSWAEVAGSIYKWTAEEAISGTPSAGVVNHIKLVPSGSGDTAIVTATWTTASPTWSDAYQGYYSGTSRYVAGCYYDGANYTKKFIYFARDVREYNIGIDVIANPAIADDAVQAENVLGLTGTGTVSLDNIPDGSSYERVAAAVVTGGAISQILSTCNLSASATRYAAYSAANIIQMTNGTLVIGASFEGATSGDAICYIPVNLPQGAVVDQIRAYVKGPGSGYTEVWLKYKAINQSIWSGTDLHIQKSGTSTTTETDSGSATIDNSAYNYCIEVLIWPNATHGIFYNAELRYTVSVPLP